MSFSDRDAPRHSGSDRDASRHSGSARDASRAGTRNRVLLVGWDAADWKVITPLMDAGKMPNVRRLVEGGVMAQIATLHPPLSPMLWTSIATGKRPFRHGIHGFAEPTPDGRGVQPVTNLSRKCKAVWNILSQNDLRSIVVGWWPSHPAEPINGVMVSDHYHRAHGPLNEGELENGSFEKSWPLIANSVYPARLAPELAALRLHPNELAPEIVLPFIPRAAEIDQKKDPRLAAFCRILCECVTIHSAATWLMDNEPWEFCAVYYDAIDHFSHAFMRYHPPRQAHIAEEDFDLYSGVVAAAYQFHDQMLGTLLSKVDADTRVILMSDHGFHPDHLRPRVIPEIPAGPAVEHRDFGILVMQGPGIRSDELLHGPCVLDIAPTVLNMFGLPAGEDMDGRPLSSAFTEPPAIPPIPTWEDVPGADGRHPAHMRIDAVSAKEALDQMVALGYIEKLPENAEQAVAATATELRYNLAQSYQDAGRHREALEIFRELYRQDRDEQRFAVNLFVCAQALGLRDEMSAVVEDLDGWRRAKYEDAMRRGAEIQKAVRERCGGETSPSDPESQMTADEREKWNECKKLARFNPLVVEYLRAQVFVAKRQWGKALECIERIQKADPLRPQLFLQVADLAVRMSLWETAENSWKRALAIDPDHPGAHLGMCRLALHRKDFERAAEFALESLRRLYQNPIGHFFLGISLAGMRDFDRAAEAFRVAIGLNPNFPQAHLRLAWLLRRRLGQPDAAAQHFRIFRDLRANAGKSVKEFSVSEAKAPAAAAASSPELPPLGAHEAVIVSGMPRSGTSMIMQMLVAGGLTPLTDGIRQPDEDNPRGYFEFEPVKQMTKGADWFGQAEGKAVKIVAPLLPSLPSGRAVRIVYIDRNPDELLASQGQMLIRRGEKIADTPERRARLKEEYIRLAVRLRAMLAARPSTQVLYLDRNAVLGDPNAAAQAMNRFLGGALNVVAMAGQVKPELHRQRAS